MSAIVLDVVGLPTPQGSKRPFIHKHTGRPGMAESSSDRLKVWRADVKAAVAELIEAREPWQPLDGPLSLTIVFKFLRGKGHYRTGRNAHLLKDNAPAFPTTGSTGDVDKLVRATLDALAIAGLFVNDKQVAHVDAWKVFVEGVDARPGARIEVRTLDDVAAVPVQESQEVLL